MVKNHPKDPNEQLEHAFAVFDKDGNGTISSDELKQVSACLIF